MKFINNKQKYGLLAVLVIFFALVIFMQWEKSKMQWKIQSIDTMKFSRDRAREELSSASTTKSIDSRIARIAKTGATYVAIDTPYDDEFLPVLKVWVSVARKYHLHVWFRGNWSGWEQWFSYPKISEETHMNLTKEFIAKQSTLFKDGDIFSSCPECENRTKVDLNDEASVKKHRDFLIKEYSITKEAFRKINKNVGSNYFSMNYDAASVIMDKETTRKLDGIVVIDHYVKDPGKLASDIRVLAEKSGGKVFLGEFGAPIPSIHGQMNEWDQNKWLSETLRELSSVEELIGVNYWVDEGGSTSLWNDDGSEKAGVVTLRHYFKGMNDAGAITASFL